jgi:hypothetical protein
MRILSIDIGLRNTSFYIESFDEKKISEKTLYTEGKREFWELVDFTIGGSDVLINILDFLDKNKKIWKGCNGVIIERQMKINFLAQNLQHYIFSYFKQNYPFKFVSDISASRKTQALGAPKKMTKPERKKWAVLEAQKVCELRNDIRGIQMLYSKKKADDLADSMIQLKAFQKLLFIQKVIP